MNKKTIGILVIFVALVSFFTGCENPESASGNASKDTVVVYEGGSGSTKTIVTITNDRDYTIEYNGEIISRGGVEKNGSELVFTSQDGDNFTADLSNGGMVFDGPIPVKGGGSITLPELAEKDEFGFHIKALSNGILVYLENIPAGINQINLQNLTTGDYVQYVTDTFDKARAGTLFAFVQPDKDYTFQAEFEKTDGSGNFTSKSITVRSIGGKGEIISNKDELLISYNGETKSIRLNKEPQKGYANDPAITGSYQYIVSTYPENRNIIFETLPGSFSVTSPRYLYEIADTKNLIQTGAEIRFKVRYYVMYNGIEYRVNFTPSAPITFPSITAGDVKIVRLINIPSVPESWWDNKSLKLLFFYSNPLKKNMNYKIKVSGTSDTYLDNFYLHGIEAVTPNGQWYEAIDWDNSGHTVINANVPFSFEFTKRTKNEQTVLDYNGSYFLHFGNNSPSFPHVTGENIMATISNFSVTIEELP
jgi:hypothetical protein